MSTTPRSPARKNPDWSAINRSFDAKQRKAFNAFVARVRISSLYVRDGLEYHRFLNEYPPGHPMANAIKEIQELPPDLLDPRDVEMTYFPPFDSLPTAADLEAARHANDWIHNPKRRSVPSADNEKPVHQQIQGIFAGASHTVPTPTGETNGSTNRKNPRSDQWRTHSRNHHESSSLGKAPESPREPANSRGDRRRDQAAPGENTLNGNIAFPDQPPPELWRQFVAMIIGAMLMMLGATAILAKVANWLGGYR